MKILLTPAYGFLLLKRAEVKENGITSIDGKGLSSTLKYDGYEVVAVAEGSEYKVGDYVLHNLEKMPTFNCRCFDETKDTVVYISTYVISESDIWGVYKA